MTSVGPPLTLLQHRLTDAPRALWQSDAKTSPWPLPALVHDLLWHHTLAVTSDDLKPFRGKRAHHPWYAFTQLIAWFLMDSAFTRKLTDKHALLQTLTTTAEALQASGRLSAFVEDPDRREEFIRVVLASLGLRPQDESEAQAQDRLLSISASERMKVIAAARAAEERAREVREALARKAAEEAADKWTRE